MKTRSINDDGISSNRKAVFDDTLKDANSIDYGKYLNKNNKHNIDVNFEDLSGATNIPFIPYACPEKGEFVAFKKCGEYIIELLIPADAKRCSGTTRECRASYAKVLSITTILGKPAKTTG